MCIVCIEYHKKRMTREEMLRALPELIQFAKTEEEKIHFKKLKELTGAELDKEIGLHLILPTKK